MGETVDSYCFRQAKVDSVQLLGLLCGALMSHCPGCMGCAVL